MKQMPRTPLPPGYPETFRKRTGKGERKRERAPATAGAAKSSYGNVNGLKKEEKQSVEFR